MKIDINEFQSLTGVSLDDLCNEAYELLTARKWNVTKAGIAKNIDTWLESKSDKIRKMVQHPNYNGNLQIVIPATITRTTATAPANRVLRSIESELLSPDIINRDENGKTARDRIVELAKNMGTIVSADDVKQSSIGEGMSAIYEEFESSLTNIKTYDTMSTFQNCIYHIRYNLESRISEDVAERVNAILRLDKKKVIVGQKTSKVVSRILHMTKNYDRYNKLFTNFADLINENKQEGYYVVSLNFLDYLRMSDGNSWSSCHTTDYKNTRGMENTYSGQYVQGTLSYANDDVSYVTYFIDKDADLKHADRNWKIYRCMYHVKPDEKLYIGGRVYPQNNDGSSDIYNEINRLWVEVMGYQFGKVGRSKSSARTESNGANYADYDIYNNCMLYVDNGNNDYSISIGHLAYSCNSGRELPLRDHGTIV